MGGAGGLFGGGDVSTLPHAYAPALRSSQQHQGHQCRPNSPANPLTPALLDAWTLRPSPRFSCRTTGKLRRRQGLA